MSAPEIEREPTRIGGVSVVFVATKTTAIDSVAADLAPLLPTLGDRAGAPFVVSFQNGIEPGRQMMERLNDPRVLKMVLNYSAHLAPDGVVEIMHSDPPHWIGSPNAAHPGACGSLASLLTRAGLETRAAEDIEPLVWSKGLINTAMSPVAALVNASVGDVLDSHGTLAAALALPCIGAPCPACQSRGRAGWRRLHLRESGDMSHGQGSRPDHSTVGIWS